MSIVKVENLESFEIEVGLSEDVIVKFEADWCYPCKAVGPIVEEIAKQNPQFKFISVDIEGDGIEHLVAEYGVRTVPTFVRVRQGKPVASSAGTISKQELRKFIS